MIPILGLPGKSPVQILLTLHLCSCFLYGLAFLTNPNEFNKQIGIFYACMFLAEKPKGFPGRFLVHNKNNSEPSVFVIMCAPIFLKTPLTKVYRLMLTGIHWGSSRPYKVVGASWR